MGEPHVITALHRKYAEIMGELRKCEGQADKHRASLEHIEATMRLFKPEWTGEGIRPHKPHRASRWPKRGAGMKAALSVLRDATEPLTTRQIVLMALERHNIAEPDYDELKLICSSFNSAFRNQAAKGGLVVVEGRPVRWAIAICNIYSR
jgi:hypothetical protein